MPGTKIIDIRSDTAGSDILADIRKGLRPDDGGEKNLPTLLLYDEFGLRLFEKITYLDQYYLTNAEIEVLETYADQIAQRIPSDSILVELGSGNLRKVNILLQAIDRLGKVVEYYAVDLSLPELKRTFAEIPTEGYKHVKCFGLYGTYDNALEWLKSPEIEAKPKTILWLGSSLGNFKRHEVPLFLAGFGDVLQSGDMMLIGIDSCKDPDRVFHAYNDRENVTHEFILNGLNHANGLMGETVFNLQDWEVIGEYDQDAGRHHAFVSPQKDVVIDGVPIAKGERVRIEESYKFSQGEIMTLWEGSKLAANTVWSNSKGDYGLHLVSKPAVFFPTKPEEYASTPVPSLSEWRELWAAWDAVTRSMIPEEELLSKPINLRHACIFYLGHIPTFLDIHLARGTNGKPSDPAFFWDIFERGIDPDVEDPTKCHSHSDIPDEWPPLEDILKHQQTVRARAEALYSSGETEINGRVARAMWLGFEHEAMHLETLLYMLVQSESVLPPPGTVTPDFAALAKQAETVASENEWFTIPESHIHIGLDDPDKDHSTKRYFGWDNERPHRTKQVKSFRAKARPITNGEYATYLEKTGTTAIPASWCERLHNGTQYASVGKRDSVINGLNNGSDGLVDNITDGKYVRTVYGTIPLKLAMGWPVVASFDELSGCALWMGGRIPTAEEVRSIYNYVDSMKMPEFESLGNTIPAVNGHLCNNGVDESPPSDSSLNGNSSTNSSLNPRDLFIDLEGTNVGFKHWHPVSVMEKGAKLCGQSDLGGVWEWTSTVLEKHDGFEPMELYPGYTADFFDGKHNITLGGSWATHPRLAGRKTFVNWYQRNYPYVWAGARIVTDI
ncbi:C-type lectin protein [Pyrenochaeta sp. MPI-SDFR-AT-0127]|nr:C-type lectin protein [Pyrenochaeta sp. MPI-SDFR-AT-0127]